MDQGIENCWLAYHQISKMAYDRGEASWESELVPEFPLDELDAEVIERYRATIGTSLTAAGKEESSMIKRNEYNR